ncbi:MAG: DUF2586 domain-containing protein [Desulfarculales bacterium]|nr:DUF2586 domain-containing protein [Desulfarculales bacterium]
MGDVFEYIVDGTSGLAPGAVDGKALMAGVCSKGETGKGYLLGKDSDLSGLLGSGPLVDCLRDYFAAAGQDAVMVAVPVQGSAYGQASPLKQQGPGAEAYVSGLPSANAEVTVKVRKAGLAGTANVDISLDGGLSYEFDAVDVPGNGILVLDIGCQLNFPTDISLVADTTYSFRTLLPVGPVTHKGQGPEVSAEGEPKAAASVILQITKSGRVNQGQYRLSLDGGQSWDIDRTLPLEGEIIVGDSGVSITLPGGNAVMAGGDEYHFEVYAPVPSISAIMAALDPPLELFNPECIYIIGDTDASDWAALGVLSEDLWNKHRPTIFVAHTRLPFAGEDMDDWVAWCLSERQQISHRFVLVSSAFARVSDVRGQAKVRNMIGLLAGRISNIPVMRAIGRVRDAAISGAALPDNLREAHQKTLEDAGYITAKRYAGLTGVYWGDARTLAEPTSDYRYLEVLRVVFKGLRLARIAALKSLYDEAGDPLATSGALGINWLIANLHEAMSVMIKAVPQELAACEIEVPSGQDIVNNGLAVTLGFVGLPIIRSIKLYAYYTYAGSSFDARLSERSVI